MAVAPLKSVLAQGLALQKSEITRKERNEVIRQTGQKEVWGPLEDTSSISWRGKGEGRRGVKLTLQISN